jgi:hypothetical protein
MSNIALFNSSNVPAFARAELSDTAKALMGGGAGGVSTKRISIKGGVFRLLAGGKEIASIEERHLDVIIVKAAPKVARVFYAAKYDNTAAAAAPDCWSNDGEKPDASIKEPQAKSCAQCAQNIAGSGNGQSRACRYQQRLAVVLANNPEGDVLQLTLPATSIFGKEDGDKRPLQAYARYLAAQTPPISPDMLVTRMKFDMKSESPKLVFAPVEWVSDYEVVKQQAESKEAAMAINMTVAQADGVAKVAPLAIGGTRPAAATVAILPEQDDAEEEAPAPAPKPKKAKAAPVVDESEEPEVRKPAAKEDAVPAKKSKLADIVADWDDE